MWVYSFGLRVEYTCAVCSRGGGGDMHVEQKQLRRVVVCWKEREFTLWERRWEA